MHLVRRMDASDITAIVRLLTAMETLRYRPPRGGKCLDHQPLYKAGAVIAIGHRFRSIGAERERDGDGSGGRERAGDWGRGGRGEDQEEPHSGLHQQEAALLLRQSRQGITGLSLHTNLKL